MSALGNIASMASLGSIRQQPMYPTMADVTDPHDAAGAAVRARKQRFLFTEEQDILLVRETIKDFPYGAGHGDRLKMWGNMAARLQ